MWICFLIFWKDAEAIDAYKNPKQTDYKRFTQNYPGTWSNKLKLVHNIAVDCCWPSTAEFLVSGPVETRDHFFLKTIYVSGN
jgi:hypothetical protein